MTAWGDTWKVIKRGFSYTGKKIVRIPYYSPRDASELVADADEVSYTPAVTSDWISVPSLVSGALNELASRVTDTEEDVQGIIDSLPTTDSLSPLTTKGDLFTFDTDNQRLPVGTNGQVLTADSGEATGLKWSTPSDGISVGGYFSKLAALQEPDAIEVLQIGAFAYTVGSSDLKYVLASFATRLGASGRYEIRDPSKPFPLVGETMTGLGGTSTGVFLDPTLPTYDDPFTTYYDRLSILDTLKTMYYPINAPNTTDIFLPGAYGCIITGVTVFEATWIVAQYQAVNGWNLANELGDTGSSEYVRFYNKLCLPVNEKIVTHLKSGEEKSSGVGSWGLTFVNLPSTWSRVIDPNTYNFRDDFAGGTLDTTTKWTRTISTAGNMEISTFWQWLIPKGNGSWGANGIVSQVSIAHATDRVFLCKVFCGVSGAGNIIVGFHDGTGVSYTDFAYGIDFVGGGDIQIFENGNNRGVTGTWVANRMYIVRITLSGSTAAVYEIQGEGYEPLGSASWSDVTPGSSSSSTTPLYAGVVTSTANGDWYIGDVRVY
jgi:hypothetical protein